MSLLAGSNLTVQYGARTVLDAVSLSVQRRDRLGLVGANGSGKSTLLRLLSGETTPDDGEVVRARGVRVGYLKQEHGVTEDEPLLEHVLAAAPGRDSLEARLAEVEADLGTETDVDRQMELSEVLADLVQEQTHLEEDYAPHRAQTILVGLGFSQDDFRRSVAEFSGGWRMRADLARLLFERPEVLLLDEPTNHLDMPSVAWLSSFLKRLDRAVILTCHDRTFLNRHIDRVASLELEGLRTFQGNYDAYLQQREIDLLHMERRSEKEEKKKKELEAFVTRFKAKASKARQAQSKAKIIEKLEAAKVDIPRARRTVHLKFPPCKRTVDPVLHLRNLKFGYEDLELFNNLDLTVRRGDRVVLVGPNGAGKTTLLRLIAQELKPQMGDVEWGRHADISYFAQHHTEVLDPNARVIDAVEAVVPTASETELRTLLGAFLFSGDDASKSIGVLSGGEKARVALARILAQPGNVLLLDEPTNHLDTESADKLTESLEGYDGTIIFVSHNLDFARRLSTVVWDVQPKSVAVYPGTLGEYLEHLDARAAELESSVAKDKNAAKPAAKVPSSKAERMAERDAARERKKAASKLKRDIDRLEQTIAELETKKEQLEAELADPRTHEDLDRSRKKSQAHENAVADLDKALGRWTELEEQREEQQGES